MPNRLFLELVSPERQLVSTEVDEIYAPGTEGDFGVLPDHAAMLCSLKAGEFRYMIGGDVEYVALDGGFLEVIDNKVTVLADGADLGREINLEEVLKRKLEVEKDIDEARRKDAQDFATHEAQLMREVVRINVAQHYNK